jgi:hypothetical protein
MLKNNITRYITFRNVALAILCIVCIALILFFAKDIFSAYKKGTLFPRRRYVKNGLSTATSVQPWMTFGYVNVIYHLPPSFLKEKLEITNPHYPNIQIGHYAKSEGLTNQEIQLRVNEVVKTYQTR